MNANTRDFEAEIRAQHERAVEDNREETRISPEAEVRTASAL